LNRELGQNRYLGGDSYTIADMATWPWYGNLARGIQYDAGEFLQVQNYPHVIRWAEEIAARPAVIRGRMVNRITGEPSEQLPERHSAADFEKLADYDQVGRALRQLVRKGVLIKLGYGLYVKSKINRFTNQPMISAAGGFRQVAYEALKRLGVNYEPSELEKQYQEGSTQIPAKAQVLINDRFQRKVSCNGQILIIDRV